jgi:hypothetical protein
METQLSPNDLDQAFNELPAPLSWAESAQENAASTAPPSCRGVDSLGSAPRLSWTRQREAIAAWTGSAPRYLASTERHPKGHKETAFVVRGYDCTALYRQKLREELLRSSRHLRPADQQVSRALAADVTIMQKPDETTAKYYWSQGRLADRARQRRETTNRSLKRLAENGLVIIPPKRRRYGHPKTLELPQKLLLKIERLVVRVIERLLASDQGHNRRRSLRSPLRHRFQHILRAFPGGPRSPASRSPGGKLPSLEEVLDRFRRKWQRGDGGWRVNCPCHGHHSTSKQGLALAEGKNGQLLYHCFGGCDHSAVRAALVAKAAA